MALEDVVQGVQVNVKTDGVDDAKSKIGELDKAIGDLSKTADTATGGNGGRAGGIGGLSKAFSDLSATGAEAFANIARSAASGDIVGLATLLGGRFSGSIAEAGKALGQFALAQDSAAARNSAMAKEFGTTPEIMQGIKESFAGAGISASGFERLVNRMSRQVTNDYAGMMASLRTDNDTQEKATLRLQAAQEKYQISLGVPKETFEAQDQLRQQKLAQIEVDDAIEAQRQTALKSIPNVTEKLRESARAHSQDADLMEVSVGTLRKSIEYMAGSVPGHIAKGTDVLKTEFDLIKNGAIDADKAFELLTSQMGSMRGAGLGGMDASQAVQYALKYGSSGITAAQTGQSEISKAGLGQTSADTAKATEAIAAWSKFTGLFEALMQRVGTTITPAVTGTLNGLSQGLENLPAVMHGAATGITAAVDAVKSAGSDAASYLPQWAQNFLKGAAERRAAMDKAASDQYQEYINKQRADMKAKNPAEELPGTPVPGGGGVTSEQIGSGPGKVYHIPEGWTGAPPVSRVTSSQIGTGPGKFIQIPPGYGEQPAAAPSSVDTTAPEYRHMSVLDDANAPWRSLRSGGASPSIPDVGPKIEAAGGGVVSALESVGAAIRGVLVGSPAPSAVAPIPQWQGGGIHVPGFAGGGRIRISGGGGRIPGFADGGPMEGLLNAGIKVGSGLWNRVKAMAPNSAEEARGMVSELLRGHITASWAEEGIASGIELAGIEASRAAIGTSIGVLSNPFGTGMLDATTVGAADREAGARQEEERARARGATNLREANELGLWTGGIPGFAMGSIRGPGNGTSDSILARLSNGEFVMKDAAVRTYGEGFMHAINNMQIPPPKYAYGGMVPASSIPRFSEGGSMERPGSILNLHVGGEVFSGLRAPAAVADQLRKFAISQQTTQTGKKPSWAGG